MDANEMMAMLLETMLMEAGCNSTYAYGRENIMRQIVLLKDGSLNKEETEGLMQFAVRRVYESAVSEAVERMREHGTR